MAKFKLSRGKPNHTLQPSPSMLTRPMNVTGSEVDYHERSGAAFLPTLESHVFVPLLEAIISGVFFGMSAGAMVAILCIYGEAGWWNSLKYGFFTFIPVTLGWSWWSWRGHLGDYKSLLWYNEYAQSPEVEPDSKQSVEARVRVNNNWVHSDLPFDRDNPKALVDFAAGVVCGAAPFSERGAGRYGYSVQRFTELRDNMIRGHLAYWKDVKNKRLGVGLTASGTALLKSVASNPPPANYEPSDEWGMSPNIIQK